MKKFPLKASLEGSTPKKLSGFTTKKVSSNVSPAHTSYRAPLCNIQLGDEEAEQGIKQSAPRRMQQQKLSASAVAKDDADSHPRWNNNSHKRNSVNSSYLLDVSQNNSDNKSASSAIRKVKVKPPILSTSQLSHREGLRTNPVSSQNSNSHLPDLLKARALKNAVVATGYTHAFGNPAADLQTKMTATKLNKKRIKSSSKITVSGVTQSVTSFNGPGSNHAFVEETPSHIRGMHQQNGSNEHSVGNEHMSHHFGGGYSSNIPSSSTHVKAQTVYNHQRIQSNPVFLNEFNQMLANSQNQQLRMNKQQQVSGQANTGHSNTVNLPSNSSKKMAQDKRNSNSQKPQTSSQNRGMPSTHMNHHPQQMAMHKMTIDQPGGENIQNQGYNPQHNPQQMGNDPMSHYSQTNSLNQSNSGLNKAFSKVLNTLNNDNANFSRQEAANHNILNAIAPKKSLNMMAMQQAKVQTIGAAGVGHGGHQKALSMSSYMMQPKNMSFTQQQTSKRTGAAQNMGSAHHQNTGAGTSIHGGQQGITVQSSKLSKKKPLNAQQMTYMSDSHQIKTVMVQPTHQAMQQNRMDLYNQHSNTSNNQKTHVPISKTQHQNSSNTLSVTKTQQSINQKYQKTSFSHIGQVGKVSRGVKTTTKQSINKGIISQKNQTSPRTSVNISASISPQIKTQVGHPKAQIGRTQQPSTMGTSHIQQNTTSGHHKLQTGHHRRQVTLQYEPSNQMQGNIMTQNGTSFQNSALKSNQAIQNNQHVINGMHHNAQQPQTRTTQQRSNISSAAGGPQRPATGGQHRRIRSDQVSMTKKSLNQHYIDNLHTQQQSNQTSQQQQHDGSQDMDHIANSSRIVVINNNNTNINIHHPSSYQNSQHHQYTSDNIQSLQDSYNLAAGLNGQLVGSHMHSSQQTQQQQLKAKTQQNSTMRTNSITLSQKNNNPTGIQSVNSGYTNGGQISLEQSKHINQQINSINHQRLQSMDLDMRESDFAAQQSQQQNFLYQQQHATASATTQKSQKRKLLQNQQQSKHIKKTSGVPEQFMGVKDLIPSQCFIVQPNNSTNQNQSSKGNVRRTIKNPQNSGKQLMNHLKQNQGDKPSTLLNSDRSTKLGASQNNKNQQQQSQQNQSQHHQVPEEIMGYQSSSTTQMMPINQYRSGAMGGHIPVTQQQMFKNMAMTHTGNSKYQNSNVPSNVKQQMSANNLHALNNNSESQSQAQFEQYQGNIQPQYSNAAKIPSQNRQRQNNYMKSQERPDVNKAQQMQDLQGGTQNQSKHKKVNSGQLSNSQMKLYQIISNQQVSQTNNYMGHQALKGINSSGHPSQVPSTHHNVLTPEKFKLSQHQQQYMYVNSQKGSKEMMVEQIHKYGNKVAGTKNSNFQSFQRQKSQQKDDSSSINNRSPRESNQQSPIQSKGGTMYYQNHHGNQGIGNSYGQVLDSNKRYSDTQNSPISQQKKINMKDQTNLHKVQTKNRYAQSELLKKVGNQQKNIARTEPSFHDPMDAHGVGKGGQSKMSKKSVSPNDREKRGPPAIIAQINADGGQLTPRKLIMNNILMNIANKVFETKIDYYKIGKVIGKGAFGKVNLAINRLTSKFVALKSINKTYMTDESSLKKIMQEYNILKRARHQNIVRLYESFDTDSHTVYVMEVCGGGDLLTYVRRRRKLKEDLAKHVFRQLILGLMYVHSKKVLHRDIKLDNILLTSEGDVKICDFGVSKLVQSRSQIQHEQCGTPAYIAPEVFKGKGYKGFQSDVWSAGVVLYAMLFGTVPFKATNMGELQQQIINVQCSWGQPGDITDGAMSILKRILEADPNKRLTPQQILIDPWMQLTEQQISKIEVFTKHEKEKIVSDFQYYNQKKEDGKTGDDPFLEQKLQSTQNSIIKNNTTKSVILAPFNSTKSHISDTFYKRDSIQDLLVSKSVLNFANKCKEINRQYMLNNNAELDNGVYNENDGNEENGNGQHQNSPANEKENPDDGLMGLNMQIENKGPEVGPGQPQDIAAPSQIESNATSNLQSLNTSQIVIDSEKAQKVEELYGYDLDYIIESVENEELNHCTTVYYLLDQEKEF